MSDGEALRATIACADVPDGVDREATLHALRAALAETQRIEVVEAPSPAAATLHVRWRLETPRWARTPQAVVSLVLCDAVGAELERHEIGAAPAHIPSAVEHAALGFARPSATGSSWRRAARSAVSSTRPSATSTRSTPARSPSPRRCAGPSPTCRRTPIASSAWRGPPGATSTSSTRSTSTISAATSTPPVASSPTPRCSRSTAHPRRPQRARTGSRSGSISATPSPRSCCAAGRRWRDGEAWAAPLTAARARSIVAGVLGTLGCRAFQSASVEALVRTLRDTFGGLLERVFMAGMAASAGVDCPPEAVPWLHRLSAGDGPLPEGLHDLKGAHVAALSLAWARVDWEALSSYALLDVTALEARVTSSPADEGALLRLTALDPRQADRVLRGATTPLSRAIALTLRGGLRTDEGKLAEGLSDLDEALTLAPWDGLIETLRAMNLRAQRRHDEALAALDRSQRLAPDEGREAMLRGWFLLDAGRHAEAVPVLERARALRPDNADIWGNLGIALHHLGRHAEALPALERAVALNPKLGPAIRFRALTQAALKHDDAPSAEAPPAPTSGAPARMVGFVLLALALLLAVRLLTR